MLTNLRSYVSNRDICKVHKLIKVNTYLLKFKFHLNDQRKQSRLIVNGPRARGGVQMNSKFPSSDTTQTQNLQFPKLDSTRWLVDHSTLRPSIS